MRSRAISRNLRPIVFLSATTYLTACGTPPFQLFGDNVRSEGINGPPVQLFVKHLRCEAYRTITGAYNNRKTNREAWNTVRYLYWYGYQAAGQLTLDVTASEGFNPSIADIVPYHTPMTNFTLTVAGQLSGVQHRNIQDNISVNYARLFEETGRADPEDSPRIIPELVPIGKYKKFPDDQFNLQEQCGDNDGTGIQGDIGLADIVDLGLGAFRDEDAVVSPGFAATGTTSSKNVFGSTVDFTVTGGLNIGPNWTLVHFKGPTGGSAGSSGGGSSASGSSSSTSGSSGGTGQGLIAGSRSAKDTLIISFAPACRQPDAPAMDKKAPAWEATLSACAPLTQAQIAAPSGSSKPPVGPSEAQRTEALKGAAINNTQILLQDIVPSFLPQ
jgi:uncharacterized membrane protein YgcG